MIDLLRYPADEETAKFKAITRSRGAVDPQVQQTVRQILDAVRQRGDAAVAEFTREFDQVQLAPGDFRVSGEALSAALEGLEANLRLAIEAAVDNIRSFHQRQSSNSWFVEDGDGVILGKKVTPIRRVGICVPAGQVPLFSSLIMAAVPAQVAGVEEICVVSPPQANGFPHPTIMGVAQLLDLGEVYALGGAQAVAAMAWGTETVAQVDKIVGPGSPYTVAAQQQVFGQVGIALLPGPSEIVVLADANANPAFVAADLLSQAEHGWDAAAVCVTPAETLALRVQEEVERQLAQLPRAEVMREALQAHGAVVVVPDMETGIELTNAMAPEHVELLVDEPWRWLEAVRHAGAIFLGPASTEPVGDYFAGTNHILPIGRAARFASSLGVADFVKNTSIISYTETRLERVGEQIATLAEAESLTAHAQAVRVRLAEEGKRNE